MSSKYVYELCTLMIVEYHTLNLCVWMNVKSYMMSEYVYIYIHMYVCMYVYIIIYIYIIPWKLENQSIWVNYNSSLDWNKALLGTIPLTNHYLSWGRSEVVLIYPLWIIGLVYGKNDRNPPNLKGNKWKKTWTRMISCRFSLTSTHSMNMIMYLIISILRHTEKMILYMQGIWQ